VFVVALLFFSCHVSFQATESWLYDQGQGQAKAVYSARLADLRALGEPMELRAREAEEREPAAQELQRAAQEWIAWAEGNEAAFDHISAEDKGSVKSKAVAAREWLAEAMAKQAQLPLTEKPSLLSADIAARRANLEKVEFPSFFFLSFRVFSFVFAGGERNSIQAQAQAQAGRAQEGGAEKGGAEKGRRAQEGGGEEARGGQEGRGGRHRAHGHGALNCKKHENEAHSVGRGSH
jgi:hypothetical protein